MYPGPGLGGLALSGADQQWPGSFQVEGAGADVPSGTWGLLGDYYNYNSRENYQPTRTILLISHSIGSITWILWGLLKLVGKAINQEWSW